ncbi:MAG: hypothetical protein EHM46_00115 [Bacteroidetes bacterium]|nr:MAG: hypothetical protein EHM46_00115 [Bacteroidota bacterium]
MRPHLPRTLSLLLTGGALITACHTEYFELDRLSDEIELTPGLAAPLVKGTLALGDIVAEFDTMGVSRVDDEGLIYIVYGDNTYSVRADTVVEVPDKFVNEYFIDSDINTPLWFGTPIGDTAHFYKSEVFSFELDGNDRVDSILVKGGRIGVDVTSSFEHTGLLTVSSSQIHTPEGDTFSTVVVISDAGGNFAEYRIFPSDHYQLETTESGDSSYIQINFDLALINSGNLVAPDDECAITTSFLDLDFYKVYGYIDSRNLIEEGGAIELPIYLDNPNLASIVFADPRLAIHTSSSIGIPMEIVVDSLVATSSRDGSKIRLEITGEHPFTIDAPGINQIGQFVDSEIQINNSTSNIDDLLAAAPYDFNYCVTGRTRPGTTDQQHFVLDTSRLDVAVEVLLPMDLKSTGFSLQDTIDFRLGEDGLDTSMVKSVEVFFETVNEIPIHLEVQLYLMDDEFNVLDSLFGGSAVLLEASIVDTDGKLVQASEEENSVLLSTEKIARLENVTQARMVANLVTSGQGTQFVKFYSDYTLDFELSVQAQFRINNREL